MRTAILKWVAVGATLAAASMGVTASVATAAPTCSDTWMGGNADWNTAGDWSAGIPTSTSAVCIESGTASITDGDPSPDILTSLYIGNGAGLSVAIHSIVESSSTTIASGGTLTLDGTYTGANGGNASLGGGPVLNQGTINMEGSGYSATLYGTITNQGTLNVINNTVGLCYGGNGGAGSFTNEGTINIAATSSDTGNPPVLQVDGCTFTNAGGSIVNNGALTVEPANGTDPASYVQGNGTETGSAVYVHGGATLAYTGTGASSVEVATSTTVAGNLAAGQQLQADIGVVLTVSSSFTSSGNIILNPSYYGGGGGAAVLLTSGTITNNGSILAESNSNDPSFNGNFVNNGTLTITPNTEVEQLAGNFTNNGTIEPEFSSTQSSDIRFDTGTKFIAGGTVAPQLEGGFAPAADYEYQTFVMKGGSYTSTFGTVAGNWHADYANTSYVGLVYGASAAGAPTTKTTPSVAPTAKSLSGAAGAIKATITCATGSTCLRYKLTAKVTEHLKKGKISAVSARAGESTKKKTKTTKVVTVATASGSVAAGKKNALTIKLNKVGAALLKRFGKLKVAVTLEAGGKTLKTATITVTEPKAKGKKK